MCPYIIKMTALGCIAMPKIIEAHWYNGVNNVGDMLTVPILRHFGYEAKFVPRNTNGKLLMVGSIMSALRERDVVLGSGCIRPQIIEKKNVTFLAVRGPKTRRLIRGSEVPRVYGDPALLMPLVYDPEIEVKHKIGVIPHYVDKPLVNVNEDELFIDIQKSWVTVVRQIKSCEVIISSSLHGLILAEAYGKPARWVRYSNKIIGGNFKYHDYLLGTGRDIQGLGKFPPIPDLPAIQQGLIKAIERLKDYENK